MTRWEVGAVRIICIVGSVCALSVVGPLAIKLSLVNLYSSSPAGRRL